MGHEERFPLPRRVALEKGSLLSDGPDTDRQMRITSVITEAIGHVDEPPDNHRPGYWREQSRRPGWGFDEVADAIYVNLAHHRYVAEEGIEAALSPGVEPQRKHRGTP